MKIDKLVLGPIRTNTYIISSDKGNAILIDPGAEASKIFEFIGLNKLNLKYIFLTHAHFDHVMALEELKNRFDEAVVVFSNEDLDFLNYLGTEIDLSKEYYKPEEVLRVMEFLSKDKENNITELKEGELIGFDDFKIQVIETPGHTKGGLSFLLNDTHLFSGDTLFRRNIGGTDFYGGDMDQMKKSISKLLELKDDTTVYPGHGDTTTIGEERKWLSAL